MGSPAPRTRNAQVALYQSGEVDFLVATDAIGMGLNMDVDHVAFAGLRKFDGKRHALPAPAGDRPDRRPRRALQTNGTFGVTGEAEDMDAGPGARRWRTTASSRSPAPSGATPSSTSPPCPLC